MMPAAPRSLRLSLRTPEQIVLPFEVAPAALRFLALALDLAVLVGLLLGLLVLLTLFGALAGDGGGWVEALFGLSFFLLSNFYFAGSELYWQGRTLGKRKLGLRVVARDGGPLSASMVLTRNLTRDLELWLPVLAFFAPEAIFGDTPGWGRALAALWILALVCLPLANSHRARLGDLVAGTVVVVEPKAVLMPDLSHDDRGPASAPQYAFTTAQLDIYGIEELHVLEGILRRDSAEELLEDVARRIARKIRFKRAVADEHAGAFLHAFYAAQRARLEQKALFGKRQERKVR
jgi:uncharacterized RDD family membrane protein YckC